MSSRYASIRGGFSDGGLGVVGVVYVRGCSDVVEDGVVDGGGGDGVGGSAEGASLWDAYVGGVGVCGALVVCPSHVSRSSVPGLEGS